MAGLFLSLLQNVGHDVSLHGHGATNDNCIQLIHDPCVKGGLRHYWVVKTKILTLQYDTTVTTKTSLQRASE